MSAQVNFRCHGCEERKPGCHSTCGKYKDDRAKLDQLKQEERKERIIESYHNRYNDRAMVKDAKQKLRKDRYYAKGKSRV
jgi:queuine/archaeosine tRNA-ribosyltransferase